MEQKAASNEAIEYLCRSPPPTPTRELISELFTEGPFYLYFYLGQAHPSLSKQVPLKKTFLDFSKTQ